MWVYIPSTYSPFAPAPEDSTSDLSWLFPMLEQSLMWRSKPTPAKSWQRAWKRNIWLQHLCGRISKPLTAAVGVDLWMASLAATRANRSAWPVACGASTTLDTCGRTSEAPSRDETISSNNSADRPCSSSKTLPTIYRLDSATSLETYKVWATELRRGCLQRRKSARHTNANDSSSWRTPSDDAKRGGAANPDDRKAQGHTINLQDQAAYWSTPRASDAEKGGPNQSFGAGGTPLPAQAVQMCGIPTSRDWKDGENPSEACPTNGLLSRQAPRSLIGGSLSSTTSLSSHQLLARRQLNPTFVEWLMGWPPGWTVCVSSVTEWSHYKQRMRSLLFARLSRD